MQISDNIEMSFVATKYKPSVSLLTDTYYTVVLVDYLIMSRFNFKVRVQLNRP